MYVLSLIMNGIWLGFSVASALSAVFFLNNECIEFECGLGITKESCQLDQKPNFFKNKICGAV
jgi:hypothetical protein